MEKLMPVIPFKVLPFSSRAFPEKFTSRGTTPFGCGSVCCAFRKGPSSRPTITLITNFTKIPSYYQAVQDEQNSISHRYSREKSAYWRNRKAEEKGDSREGNLVQDYGT